ncbi:BlaI/MecI/CopY family transcriptional regulator [Mangrovimicrobium sediminis]|uniref:BlaI/MecI/CopY family transcriptional regulator n=1 Tax=Mangrovimicrobium sediminis TaxID=2562682 RepID=A0A4Z0M7H4_9GAMM|nr:BlaI/MecI/CopY family transcriptional regulator [Haliea sp. SAOS-164]TGD75491.1 BlaI/MecI/CopY family transcriptional regulator [Haliea sp. SAOS-164]
MTGENRPPPGASSNALPRLGELELAVMEVLWRHPASSTQQVQARLPQARRNSLSTLQSTLERLHRKGLLGRERERQAYLYRARVSRSELLGRLLGGVISQLHDGSLDPILASFVDFAENIDDSTLDRLDELLQARLRARDAGGCDD